MADTETFRWTDPRGNEQTREVNLKLDIRNFEGRAGYALLLIAANPHLSYDALLRYLETKGVERTLSWLRRRRWMFHPDANSGAKANRDGKSVRAVAVMRENSTLSLRELVRVLKENGITRSKDWVRQHRCD